MTKGMVKLTRCPDGCVEINRDGFKEISKVAHQFAMHLTFDEKAKKDCEKLGINYKSLIELVTEVCAAMAAAQTKLMFESENMVKPLKEICGIDMEETTEDVYEKLVKEKNTEGKA